jgi:hypothetical protein
VAIYTGPGGRQIPWQPKPPKPPRIPQPDPHPSVPKPDPAPPWPGGGEMGPVRPGPFGVAPPPPRGVVAPTPPATPPPAAAPPPTPPVAPQPPDFNAYYTSDPRYLQQNPVYAAMESAIYAQYGWVPDGRGGYTQQSRADNPYSVANQLARSLSQNSAGIMNQANARGTLFSGAQAAGQNQATDAYNQALNQAALGMKDELLGVADQRAALINSLYPDYLEQVGTLGAAPPPPPDPRTDPVAAAAAAAKGDLSSPLSPLPAPPTTGMQVPGKNNVYSQVVTPPKPPKKKKPPKKGGATQTLTTGGAGFGSAPPPPR